MKPDKDKKALIRRIEKILHKHKTSCDFDHTEDFRRAAEEIAGEVGG